MRLGAGLGERFMVVDKLKSWAMKMSDKDKELRRWLQGRE